MKYSINRSSFVFMKALFAVICCLFFVFYCMCVMAQDKKTLIIGTASDIHTLDPAVSMDNSDWRQTYPAYDRLVRYEVVKGQGTTRVEPFAASAWSVSGDGLIWTFYIRSGISFADGTALDAEAVRFSLQRALDVGKGPAQNFNVIESMRVIDPLTLEIKLKRPFGPFLQTLATNAASIINPAVLEHTARNDLGQDWLRTNTDGSGPFSLKEWVPGKHAVLQASKDYWGGTPWLDEVIVKFIPNPDKRMSALEKGRIHIAENLLMEQLTRLEDNQDITVHRYPSQLVEYVYINTQRSHLSDPRVRRALNLAVDYHTIIENVLHGNAVQMKGPIPQGMWGHNPYAYQYEYNPQKAADLLSEAGVEDLKLTLKYSERRSEWKEIAQALQTSFSRAGIGLKLEFVPNPDLREQLDRGDFDLCLGVWSPDFADPYMFMNFWFDSAYWGLPGNRSFYKNVVADDLLRQAARSSSVAGRTKLYSRVQDIVISDAPYIFLHQIEAAVPMHKSVQGYVYNPMLESIYNIESIWIK